MIKKAELLELAAVGMHRRLMADEARLAEIWKEFPQLFLGETPPTFVRPEPRESSNGHWPPIVATRADEADKPAVASRGSVAAKASWTPERRAKQARSMKRMLARKRQAKGVKTVKASLAAKAKAPAPKSRAASGEKTTRPQFDLRTYQHIFDHLTLHPASRLQDIANAIDAKHPANAFSRMKTGLKRGFFTRDKDGLYHAGKQPLEA